MFGDRSAVSPAPSTAGRGWGGQSPHKLTTAASSASLAAAEHHTVGHPPLLSSTLVGGARAGEERPLDTELRAAPFAAGLGDTTATVWDPALTAGTVRPVEATQLHGAPRKVRDILERVQVHLWQCVTARLGFR